MSEKRIYTPEEISMLRSDLMAINYSIFGRYEQGAYDRAKILVEAKLANYMANNVEPNAFAERAEAARQFEIKAMEVQLVAYRNSPPIITMSAEESEPSKPWWKFW